jgi:hypothetical protein
MPKRKRSKSDAVAVAREVALAEVARRWPELVGVEPTVTLRQQRWTELAETGRLGAGLPGPAPGARRSDGAVPAEYTFTFASHVHTPDGYTMPRVARVTVDAQRRVVKATTSK